MNIKLLILLPLVALFSCGFPEYVYEGEVFAGPEIAEGIGRAEVIASEDFKRDDLVVGTEPGICGKTYMACVVRPNLIMISKEFPIAAQICHEVLHTMALDYHDVWDRGHNIYDYYRCNV
jgi:hypothetical protein